MNRVHISRRACARVITRTRAREGEDPPTAGCSLLLIFPVFAGLPAGVVVKAADLLRHPAVGVVVEISDLLGRGAIRVVVKITDPLSDLPIWPVEEISDLLRHASVGVVVKVPDLLRRDIAALTGSGGEAVVLLTRSLVLVLPCG